MEPEHYEQSGTGGKLGALLEAHIQAYMHAYRAATGIDLTLEPVNSTLPSVLLLKRLASQRPTLSR